MLYIGHESLTEPTKRIGYEYLHRTQPCNAFNVRFSLFICDLESKNRIELLHGQAFFFSKSGKLHVLFPSKVDSPATRWLLDLFYFIEFDLSPLLA